MEIRLKQRLLIAGSIVLALRGGWAIANEELLLAAFIAAIFALGLASRLTRLQPEAILAGVVLVGYLVGNRGFAQLNVPGVPLLPGELVLAVGVAMTFWRAARTQELPIIRDGLNYFVLAWIAFGLVRVYIDVRAYGFLALRDFAITYYSIFFFLGQAWGAMPRENRWIFNCLTLGLALTAPVFYSFLLRPDFFTAWFTIGRIPLVFVKSDVAGGFMAAAAIWFADRFLRTRTIGWLLVSAFALFGVFISNSRGAIVAMTVGFTWLIVLRAWRMLRFFAALVGLALAVLTIQAFVFARGFTSTPLYRIYESVLSIVDYRSLRTYQVADLADKPDNNQYRLVWWHAVIDETWADGRWMGLGYGHDLAGEFVRIYYADAAEDFSARSPHNFLITVFGRMGLLGFGGFAVIIFLVARRTWRAGQYTHANPEDSAPLLLWLTGWMILSSACFGVVLEGPMGAMVFWTSLGLANARMVAVRARATEPAPVAESSEALPAPASDVRPGLHDSAGALL